MNKSFNFYPNFNAKWVLYSIIDGANLAEFEARKSCFNECCKEDEREELEENTKKFRRLLDPHILGIPFKFDT